MTTEATIDRSAHGELLPGELCTSEHSTCIHPQGATLYLGGQAWCHPALASSLRSVEQLTLYPGNPRRGDQDAITNSIRDLGIYKGQVTTQASTGHVLTGNHTLRGLLELGALLCPASDIAVDDTRAAAIVERDNHTSDLGTYDDRERLALLERLDAEGALALAGHSGDDLLALRNLLAGSGEEQPRGPSLADRFLVPPFSVLDGRSGVWLARKREWLSLGIASEVGRDAALLGGLASKGTAMSDQLANRDQHNAVHQAKAQRARSGAYGAKATTEPDGSLSYEVTTGATSIFDPVVCELAMRWFSREGGHVLDPFAGGSVRGIVAAALGRHYTGIELRAEQVAANREQADLLCPRLARTEQLTTPKDRTPKLTPLEQHAGVWVKRDDLYRRAGQRGGKVRTCWHLATTGEQTAEGLITASSRQSPQAIIVAHIAQQLGIPCRLHMPSGAETPEMAACRAAGAVVVQHKPGRNTVIVKRARDDAEARPTWRLIPFGMECPEAVEQTATQAASLTKLGPEVTRVVVPVGSGMSLAGLLHGMDTHDVDLPVLGVVVGADPTARLDTYAPEGWRHRVELVSTDSPYEQPAATTTLGHLELDAHYEAKALPYLAAGDLLWVVGTRTQDTGKARTVPAPVPRWLEGDSREVLAGVHTREGVRYDELLPAAATFDLLFSCPPYADLEQYSDDPADLSNMDWPDFCTAYRAIISASLARLAPNRFAVWVVGEVRDKRGNYRNLVGETIEAFTAAGARYYNDAVLISPAGSLPVRAGKLFTSTRKLGKSHQNVLVFLKGDHKAATEYAGHVDVFMPDGWDAEQ